MHNFFTPELDLHFFVETVQKMNFLHFYGEYWTKIIFSEKVQFLNFFVCGEKYKSAYSLPVCDSRSWRSENFENQSIFFFILRRFLPKAKIRSKVQYQRVVLAVLVWLYVGGVTSKKLLKQKPLKHL